jgi:tetratricopeptide (TPR) repeat protein
LVRADSEGKQVARNNLGHIYEQTDRLNEAIAIYEDNVRIRTFTPFPYLRLAIIYRKSKRLEDELRVLEVGLSATGGNRNTDIGKRLEKVRQLFARINKG